MTLPSTPAEFDKRHSAWLRIEPRCRTDDMAPGVQARVADPLWMLARQWQTGEFLGEDAGSPVLAELQYSTQSIDDISLGGGPQQPIPPSMPLEALVEQEQDAASYREGVRVGQELERRVREMLVTRGEADESAAMVAYCRAEAGFPTWHYAPVDEQDEETRAFVRLMAGKVTDGMVALAGPLRAAPESPLDQADLNTLHADLVAWYGRVCCRPDAVGSPAWRPERLDSQFELNAAREDPRVISNEAKTRLVAADYQSGTLDWFSFSVGAEGPRGPWADPTGEGLSVTTPTAIEVAGTSPRWWEFEDAYTNFGALDVSKPELGKLLLMEYVLIYGDDFFSVPADVPAGSAVKIDSLRIRTVFGEDIDVGPARQIDGDPRRRFDLFTLSPESAPSEPGVAAPSSTPGGGERPVLFVPPFSSQKESPPIEEVLFARDEGANMMWAIETLVPNGLGRPVPGFEAQLQRVQRARREREVERVRLQWELEVGHQDEPARRRLERRIAELEAEIRDLTPHASHLPTRADAQRYLLATSVADNWIPFIPSRRGHTPGMPRGAMQFRRATMLRNVDTMPAEPVPSMSRLLELDEHALIWINEESVTRAGVRVQLVKQRARTSDGTTYVWLGRKVLTGRGEGASGLKFDALDGVPHANR